VRTRWLVVLAGVSLAANVLLGIAFVQAGRALQQQSRAGIAAVPTFCDEEKKVREELTALLCAVPPDRRAIEATLARLDTLRATHRDRALAQFLSSCERASAADRATLHESFRHQMCPWQHEGEGCCAPSPAPGSPSDHPAQPNL
jgi:hypothetical protein